MARRPTLPGPLHEREFRLLFVAQGISLLGTWMTPVALAFAVLQLTGSAADLGIVLAAELVPSAALLVIGGVWADRMSRRRLMIAAELVSFVGQAVLAVLLLTGTAEVWEIAALAALAGAADAFHAPAWTALLPQTVSPAHLSQANALRHLESNVARVGAPLLAGALVAGPGPGWAIALDAATFAAAAAVMAGMRAGDRPVTAGPREGFRREVAVGWREVRSRTWLLAMIADTALWVLMIMGPYWVVGPYVALHDLGGASAWAVVSAAYGAGTVAGGMAGLRLQPRRPLLFAVAINAAFLPLLALLAIPGPLAAVAAAAVPAGASVSLYLVLWDTTIQREVPAAALARVSSLEGMGVSLLMPVGLALAGPAVDAVGAGAVMWAGAAWLGVSTAFLLAMPSVRGLEARPGRLEAADTG